MSVVPTNELPGARESNAGDDFHFLWVVRSSLQMVAPNAKLSGVVIEGVSRADRSASVNCRTRLPSVWDSAPSETTN
jgi:hypothetical protein